MKMFFPVVAAAPLLVFSNGRDLMLGDIHGHSLRTLVHSQNRGAAVGVDYHYLLRRLFWTDTIQNKVTQHRLLIQSPLSMHSP